MASEKQIAANRRNAQLSTGPKTESGKARSALNALKHGCRSENFLRGPYEDKEDFHRVLAYLLEDHQPQTVTEQIYIERMAIALFRLEVMEDTLACLDDDAGLNAKTPYLQQIEKFERAFDRALNQLRKLQKERRAEPRQQAPERPGAIPRYSRMPAFIRS
jgi:hypothetical protein